MNLTFMCENVALDLCLGLSAVKKELGKTEKLSVYSSVLPRSFGRGIWIRTERFFRTHFTGRRSRTF